MKNFPIIPAVIGILVIMVATFIMVWKGTKLSKVQTEPFQNYFEQVHDEGNAWCLHPEIKLVPGDSVAIHFKRKMQKVPAVRMNRCFVLPSSVKGQEVVYQIILTDTIEGSIRNVVLRKDSDLK